MDGARNTKSLDKPVYTRENLREMVAFCVEEAIRKLKMGEITFKIDDSAKEMLEGVEEKDIVWMDRDYSGISKCPSYLNPLTIYMRSPVNYHGAKDPVACECR